MRLKIVTLIGMLGLSFVFASSAQATIFGRMMPGGVQARLAYNKLVRKNPQLKPQQSQLHQLSTLLHRRGVSGAASATAWRKTEERIQVVNNAVKADKTVEPATLKWVQKDIKRYQAEMARQGIGDSNWLKSISTKLKRAME